MALEFVEVLGVEGAQALGRHLGGGQIESHRAVLQAQDAREMAQRHRHIVHRAKEAGAALAWLTDKSAQQAALPKTAPAALLSRDCIKKQETLERMAKPILATPRPAPPPEAPAPMDADAPPPNAPTAEDLD